MLQNVSLQFDIEIIKHEGRSPLNSWLELLDTQMTEFYCSVIFHECQQKILEQISYKNFKETIPSV
jgi:hypothetical protein